MDDLNPIANRYLADCRPLHIESLGAAAGMSGATFWRLTTPRGDLALRRWPAEHPTPERLSFIHAVLRHAAERGICFIPLPITTADGATFVEHRSRLWELAPWMPGVADYERAPSDEKLRAALAALAKFHVATASFNPTTTARSVSRVAESTSQSAATASPPHVSPSPNIAKRLGKLKALTSEKLNELSRAINTSRPADLAPLGREFLTLLPRVIPCVIAELQPLSRVPLPLQPCIRDIWHDHVLFTGDEVTGIVDFGALDIDTPASDIARLLGSLVSDDAHGWQAGLSAYNAMRPLSQAEMSAVSALDTSGTILAGCNWIRWIYIEGRKFEVPGQVLSRFQDIVARTKHLLSAQVRGT